MKKLIFCLTFSTLSAPAFAMFCPNGFNQINIGDTIEQVQQQCGQPDFKKTEKAEANVPQEWNYYVTPQMNQYMQTRTRIGPQASVKMSIAFKDGKAVNITVNGMSLAATTICDRKNIAVGDTMQTIKSACGDPVYVNKTDQKSNQEQKPDEITTYKYNSTPPTILIFQNGKLQSRS